MSKLGVELMLKIGTLVFLLLATMHLLGCLWLNVGRQGLEGTDGWMADQYADDLVVNRTLDNSSGFPIMVNGTGDPTLITTYKLYYIDAAYWIMVTVATTGYGDILAITSDERVFSTMTIIFGSFLSAYILGTFCNMLANMGVDKDNYDATMRSVHTMLRTHGVPEELYQNIMTFYDYKWMTKTMFNEQGLFHELPAAMQAEVVLHRYSKIIDHVPFFHGAKEDAIVSICQRLKNYAVMPGDWIMLQGQPFRELMILNRGRARSVPPEDVARKMEELAGKGKGGSQLDSPRAHSPRAGSGAKEGIDAVIEFPKGSYFGELEFLGCSDFRSMSIEAVQFCDINTLNPDDIEEVLHYHIGLSRRLDRYAKLKHEMQKMLQEGQMDVLRMEILKQQVEDNFGANEVDEVQMLFVEADADGNGMLNKAEVGAMCKTIGFNIHPEEIDEGFEVMQRHHATNKHGEINYESFNDWWISEGLRHQHVEARKDKLQQAREIKNRTMIMETTLYKIQEALDELNGRSV